MRIDLFVPFRDNPDCKALGGRWDPARHTWYVIDPHDLVPFMRWLPKAKLRIAGQKKPKGRTQHQSRPVTTEMRSDGSIPDCGCQDVAPWEECIHNEQPLDDESAARLGYLLGR